MAHPVSNCRRKAILLCLCATGPLAWTPAAQAQPWSWFFRGPAASPAIALPTAAPGPAAIPVKKVKRSKKQPIRPALPETTADDIRRTLDVTRELSSIAQRLSVEAALQLDPTLRRGDIAVTSTGLQVFRGRRAGFHAEREFQPLAKSALADRRDLRAIQVAGRYASPSAATRTAFIDVLTVRPNRNIVEVRASSTLKHGFQVIDVPRMR